MPPVVIIATRLLLAGVFALAGVAKFANLRAAAKSLVPFGIPERKAAVAASVLATAEVVFAVAILPSATALVGSLGIAALLLLFIAVIAVTLQRGLAPQCHCFGQLKSEPIGPRMLVRNTVLGVLALLVAWDAAPAAVGQPAGATWPAAASAIGSASPFSLLAATSLIVIGVLGVVVVQVLKSYGRLLVRVERLERELGISADNKVDGLAIGTPAPSFTLPSLSGGERTLASLGPDGQTVALVFIEPGCGPCNELLPEIAAVNQQAMRAAQTHGTSRRESRRLVTALVSQGTVDQNREKAAGFAFEHVLLQREREVAQAFGVVGTPSAVLVRNGLVISPLAAGPAAVRELLNGALDGSGAPLIGPGDEVPSIDVPDLDERMVDLRSLARRRTLLLFWNPDCGYCQQMLPRLVQWERRADATDPALVLVSQGAAELNRAQALRSTTVLDEGFVIGKSFGATGTPSAVLVENGRVVSGVGVGAESVFALAASGGVAAQN